MPVSSASSPSSAGTNESIQAQVDLEQRINIRAQRLSAQLCIDIKEAMRDIQFEEQKGLPQSADRCKIIANEYFQHVEQLISELRDNWINLNHESHQDVVRVLGAAVYLDIKNPRGWLLASDLMGSEDFLSVGATNYNTQKVVETAKRLSSDPSTRALLDLLLTPIQ